MDFNSKDGDVAGLLDSLNFPTHRINIDSKFSRSIGLSTGIEWLKNTKNILPTSKIFVLDTSIMLPIDFMTRITNNVQCGHSVYAPIVFKLPCETFSPIYPRKEVRPAGNWAWAAYGMIGFCLGDYLTIGGYNTSWGYYWGAEDVDLVWNFRNKSYFVVRKAEDDYYHYNCFRNASDPYYQNRNLFHKPLPITPEAHPVELRVKDALQSWLEEHSKMELVDASFVIQDFLGTGHYLIIAKDSNSKLYSIFVKAQAPSMVFLEMS